MLRPYLRLLDVFVVGVGALALCSFTYLNLQLQWFWFATFGVATLAGLVLFDIGGHLETASKVTSRVLYIAALPALAKASQLLGSIPDWTTAPAELRARLLVFLVIGLVAFLAASVYVLKPHLVRRPPSCSTEG